MAEPVSQPYQTILGANIAIKYNLRAPPSSSKIKTKRQKYSHWYDLKTCW